MYLHPFAAVLAGLLASFGEKAWAEVRSSKDYVIEAEAFDPTFETAVSEAYLVEASVDMIGGTGVEAGTNTEARSGFKGALYEVSAVAVLASPASVNETSAYAPVTALLSATAVYDDSTISPLAGTEVAWTVDAGAITSINGSGLATVGAVSTDTVSGFSGRYSGVSGTGNLIVLDYDPDNFGAYADDGLPDWWQIGTGLGASEAGLTQDPDHDGIVNRDEFAFNLDPLAHESLVAPQAGLADLGPDRFLTVTFRRNKAASDFFGLSVLRSTDLESWSPEGVTLLSVEDIDSGTESVTVRSSFPMSMQPKEFLSVRGLGPYVAMTFDDGPHPTRTAQLLDVLSARNIKATFFTVGTNAGYYPQLLQRMITEGHEIGNHTQNHPDLSPMTDVQVRAELDACHNAIVAATGVAPVLMRPPYGALTQAQKTWIPPEYGYRIVFWDLDPLDWQTPGSAVVADRIASSVWNGSVVLSHDIHAGTIEAMPLALDRLIAKGYKFVTVSELIALSAQSLE
jgi:peptidoglycan/xylan/chitin deacetylase (PgdA/CDA1 family)